MEMDLRTEIEEYFSRLKRTLDLVPRDELNTFLNLLIKALEEGRHVYIMGNGGSAATASHFAVDFNKGLSFGKAARFRFICLSDNIPTITAYANDLTYDDVFIEQLKNQLEPDDLVIGISGSGNSRNVLKAVNYANSVGARTLGLTGYDGGELKKIAQYGVNVPIADMQVSEDFHMILDHMAYSILGRFLPAEKNG
jgi:D-sedoheptulose 7-phosphate isomerase